MMHISMQLKRKFDLQSTWFQGFIRSYDNTSTHDEIIQIKRDNNSQLAYPNDQ